MKAHSLKREEMLKRKVQIKQLFDRGIRFGKYPLKIIALPVEDTGQQSPCLLMVMASARRYKKAVTRNRIKRLLRETYRQNKHLFYPYLTENNKKCLLGVMYNGNEIPNFESIENSMAALLQRVPEIYEKNHQ